MFVKIAQLFLRAALKIYHLSSRKKGYDHYAALSPKKYEMSIRLWFFIVFGKRLTRKNVKTFNEKIQWLRCYDSTLLKTRCADKYLCRDYVRGLVGEKYLTKLFGVYDSFDQIDFSVLPKQFVIKTNHGCGCNEIVLDKEKIVYDEVKAKFDRWMDINYAFLFMEIHYRDIPRKILIEEYMENEDGNLIDYKIHCFNGVPKFIQMIGGRVHPPLCEAFFDTDWNLQPFTYTYPKYKQPPEKPVNLKEMLVVAQKLCRDFSYVRVDLYQLNDGSIRFGELTFTPAGGLDHWSPPEWNRILGDMIELPPTKTIFEK